MSNLSSQLLGFAALLVIVHATQVPSASQHSKEAPDAQQTQKRESPKSNPAPNAIIGQDVIHAQPSKEKREAQKNDPTDNPHRKLDWLNGISTLVIAAFAVVTAIAVIFQVRTARRIERAWITVTIRHDTEMDKIVSQLLQVETANLECVLLNCGRTSAQLTRFAVHNCVSKALDPNREPEYGEYVQLDGMVLAPNDSFPMPIQIKQATLRAFDINSGNLYVYGIVHYLDAFNKRHFTRFCLSSPTLVGREPATEIFFRRGGPPIYSRAT